MTSDSSNKKGAPESLRVAVFAKGDREHITPVFYRNPERFDVKNLHIGGPSRAQVRMRVDTVTDLLHFEGVLDKMSRDHTDYSLEELFYLYQAAQEDLHSAEGAGA
jgi:spore coat polysaccharide biosynthesis protein SpsF (cytidylyltransferase family)